MGIANLEALGLEVELRPEDKPSPGFPTEFIYHSHPYEGKLSDAIREAATEYGEKDPRRKNLMVEAASVEDGIFGANNTKGRIVLAWPRLRIGETGVHLLYEANGNSESNLVRQAAYEARLLERFGRLSVLYQALLGENIELPANAVFYGSLYPTIGSYFALRKKKLSDREIISKGLMKKEDVRRIRYEKFKKHLLEN